MPRYNLNHQDVETIVSGLFHLAINSNSTQEHTRITNLRNRLLSKIDLNISSQDQQTSNDDLNIDVWEAFK